MIEEWGFETKTVGIEVNVPDTYVPTGIRQEILAANAVIAILMPRILNSITNLWKTLEWAHDEIGITYGVDKPLLILKDSRVEPGGLPSLLMQRGQTLFLEYDPDNLNQLRCQLALLMPGFRQWIENQSSQMFLSTLGKIAVGLGTVGWI
jgi:hypothetical protein